MYGWLGYLGGTLIRLFSCNRSAAYLYSNEVSLCILVCQSCDVQPGVCVCVYVSAYVRVHTCVRVYIIINLHILGDESFLAIPGSNVVLLAGSNG